MWRMVCDRADECAPKIHYLPACTGQAAANRSDMASLRTMWGRTLHT